MTTYEVTQEGAMLRLHDDEGTHVASAELRYYGNQRQPSIDGVGVRAIYQPDEVTRIRPSENYDLWNDAFDAASAYRDSPTMDWDELAEALGLTFVSAFARDNGR